jgi:ubiquinone/menaquinone biosynthesis C-methylase UbiE
MGQPAIGLDALGVLDAPPVQDAIETFLTPPGGRVLTLLEPGLCRVSVGGQREWRVAMAGEALPFADRSFSRLLCVDRLRYLSDAEPFLLEARRVLTPGGGVLSIAVEPPPRAVRGYLVKAGFDWSESYEVMTLEHALETSDVVETRVFATTGWISGM